MRPTTARDLWSELTGVFPGFVETHTPQDVEESEREGVATQHSVMLPFTQYFGRALSTASSKQLKTLATLLNEAVAVENDLENAVATCFLEHLRQVGGYKILAPFLSKQAKGKTHA